MIIHKAFSQTAIGIAAVAALSLSACSSSTETAEFEDAETTEQEDPVDAGPQLPEAEPGLVIEDMSQEALVLETLRPADDEIITPAGTLTIEEVEIVESVPAEEASSDTASEEDELGPAAGETFRIVNFSFTPDERTEGHSDDTLDVDAGLALNAEGQQEHLSDLDGEESFRFLISVPEDDGAELVIASEGHDQFVDVLTGERQADAQDPAATYYRDITNQDLNHAFPIPSDSVLIEKTEGHPDEEEAPVDYNLRVNSAELTAWSPEDGWAAPGEGWLAIDWSYDIETELVFNWIRSDLEDLDLTMSAELSDETLEFNTKNAGGGSSISEEHLTYLAVPEDTVDVALSFAGDLTLAVDMGNAQIAPDSSGDIEFATDPLDVSFPMGGPEPAHEDSESDDPDADDSDDSANDQDEDDAA